MTRRALVPVAAVVALSGMAGCATLQGVAALRRVSFDFDRVSDVRLAGVAVGPGSAYRALTVSDLARLTAAVVAQQVPLDLVVHVRAENPAGNGVTARLAGIDWELFLEDRSVVQGQTAPGLALPPGQPVDVPVAVRFDAWQFAAGSAADLFELALAVAGVEGHARTLRLEFVPAIETAVGPLRYPGRVTVERRVGAP